MEKLKKGISDVIRSKVSPAVEKDTREWPPTCSYFIYQPERPFSDEEETEEN